MATVTAKQHPPEPLPPLAKSDARLCVRIPARALTLQGFQEWATSDDFPEHVRAAFIDGYIYLDLSLQDPENHVGVKGAVMAVLGNLVRQEHLGKFYASGVLISNEAAGFSNNPDSSFFGWETFRSGRVRLVPRQGQPGRSRGLEGSPDWVLEVACDTTAERDTGPLREAYHRAGIPEYWMIDARGEDVYFTILLHGEAGYVPAPVNEDWQRSKVFGRDFRFTREQDEFGLPEYTLALRPI